MKKNGLTLLILCVVLGAFLQACSTAPTDAVEEHPLAISPAEDVQSVKVFDRDNTVVMEHKDPDVIRRLLQGMKEAVPAVIDDPEPSGERYELVLITADDSLTFAMNDYSSTNVTDASAKLYEKPAAGERIAAWSLPTAWVQLLLDPSMADAEPTLQARVDEDNDMVIITANRDVDRQALSDAAVSGLRAGTDKDKTPPAVTMTWADDRRAVIQFPDLKEGQTIQMTLEGVTSADGEFLRVSTPPGGYIVLQGGAAWSGLRLVDAATGSIVREHGFDAAALIQPAGTHSNKPQYLIYNTDDTTYLYSPGTGEISDLTVKDWMGDEVRYKSDYGVRIQYAHTAEANVLYAARGLETVYALNDSDGAHKPLYHSEKPIYGLAASPDGEHVALLVDAEGLLGPYADLVIIDSEGKVVSSFAKAAYIAHSDGWHWVYPVRWADNETVVVPLAGSSQKSFNQGRASYHYREGRQSAEPSYPPLPADVIAVLTDELGGWDESSFLRSLPKPGDEKSRYYAVNAWEFGTYLVDREEGKANRIGSGALIGWTPQGQVVVWHSTEGKSVPYLGLD